MLKNVIETIDRHSLIEPGERIVVGLSGGPDSVAMTHALHALKSRYDLSLIAVHLNHQIRGALADEDQKYVEAFCQGLGIPLYAFSEDIPGLASRTGLSEEEAGRKRRYELFDEVAEKEGCGKIAVAQNLNDQVETFLMRVLRGASLQGLGAIRYQREGRYIRPLLDCTRESIEAYCQEHSLNPRIDHTNLETAYFRNRVRLDLIPQLESEYNRNLTQTIARNAQLIQTDADCLNQLAEEAYKQLGVDEVKLERINQLHPAIRSRYLRKLVESKAGSLKDVGSAQIGQLMNMVQKGIEGKTLFIKGIHFTINRNRLKISREATKERQIQDEILIGFGVHQIEWCGRPVEITVQRVNHRDSSGEDPWTLYVDAEAFESTVRVRTRRVGDRFSPFGMGGRSKKLKDFMIDLKIPRDERDAVMIFENDTEIFWVAGYRMSERYRVTAGSGEIVRIHITEL